MNHARLRSFHAVAAQGSFTRAAQRLGVSQPTLSAQVKALERDYGVALFARRGRGIALTQLGERLREVTQRLFAVEQEAAELMSHAGALATGELRLGADSPAHAVPFLAAFRRKHPGIALTLAIGNAEEVLDGLLQQRSDAAVVADLAEDQRFEAIRCGRHRLVALVPREHALARRHSVRLAMLAALPAVMR
jgi:DNA-binding transcriptional LysR family regulator